METYKLKFKVGGENMTMKVKGERPPTNEEAKALITHYLQSLEEPQQQADLPAASPSLGASPQVAPAPAGGLPQTGVSPTPAGAVANDIVATPREHKITPPPPGGTTIGPMAYGAVQGATEVAGLPDLLRQGIEKGFEYLPDNQFFDTAQSAFRALTYGEEAATAPPLSKRLEEESRKILKKVGVPDRSIDPDTWEEKFIQRVVKEVTGTILSLPVLRGLSAATKAQPLAGQVLREGTIGAGQGTGAAIAQEVAPGSQGAELAGQIGGGLPLALAGSLLRKISSITDEKELRAHVASALNETTGDLGQGRRNLDETLNLQANIPGFQPTLAEATGDPGLLTLQASQRANNPQLAAKLLNQRNKNIDAVTQKINKAFEGGKLEDTRSALTGSVTSRRATLEARQAKAKRATEIAAKSAQDRQRIVQTTIDERVTRAQSRAGEAGEALAEGGEFGALSAQQQASGRARELFQQGEKAFRAEARRQFKEVDSNNEVSGTLGSLYDQVDTLERTALLSFDERDIPQSFKNFRRTIKARASRPAREVGEEAIDPPPGAPDSQLSMAQFLSLIHI